MKKIFTIFTGLSFAALLFAQTAEFSGDLSTMWGITAPGTENAGDFSIGTTDFTGTVEAYAGNGTAHIDGTVSYDAVSNSLDFSLGEAYADYSTSFWGIRLGQQKIVWVKADGIKITNSVFPEDSTSLFIDDSSIPVTAAKLSFTGSFFTIDALWIPFFKGTELPLEENNPLRNKILPSAVSFPGIGSIPVFIGSLNNPEVALKNGEYGLKLSGYFSFCDLSFYGFYGWDKIPVMSYILNSVYSEDYGTEVPQSITINGDYNRLAMVGADAALPVGPTVWRLETAFFPQRSIQASADAALLASGGDFFKKRNELSGLLGFDWMPSSWTITAQYYCDYIFGKLDGLSRENAYKHGATLSVSKTLCNENLELSFAGLIGFNDFDSAITISAAYSLNDQINFETGAYIFAPGPQKNGTYGNYKDLSTFYIKASYSF